MTQDNKAVSILRVLRFVGIALLISLGIGVPVYGVWDAYRQWDISTTWSTGDFVLPRKNDDNIRMKLTQEGDSYKLQLDYCMLYEIKPVSEDEATYSCSLTPKFYFDNYKLTLGKSPQLDKTYITTFLKWRYQRGVTSDPTGFITPILSKYTYVTELTSPTPVSVTMEYTISKPNKNFLTVMSHYFDYLTKKQTVETVAINAWKVSPIQSADDYFRTNDENSFISAWIKQNKSDLDWYAGTDELYSKNDLEFLNVLAKNLSGYNMRCSIENGQADCSPQHRYESNPAENTIFMMYLLNSQHSTIPKKFETIVLQQMAPFVYATKPNFVLPEAGGWQQMNVYQYPICPVADVVRQNWTSPNIALFQLYYNLTLGTYWKYSDAVSVAKAISNISVTPSPESADSRLVASERNAFDGNCYEIIVKKYNDPTVLTALKSKYEEMLRIRLKGIVNADSKIKDTVMTDAFSKIIYNSVMYQPYKNEFLTDNALLGSLVSNNYEKASDHITRLVQWKSVSFTLFLTYLLDNGS